MQRGQRINDWGAAMRFARFPTILLCLVCLVPITGDGELVVQGTADANLGVFPDRERRRVIFHLHNNGGTVERIRGVSQTCSCIETTVSTNAVMPECDVAVTVETVPPKLKGDFCHPLYVVTESNNPQKRIIKLTVRGKADGAAMKREE